MDSELFGGCSDEKPDAVCEDEKLALEDSAFAEAAGFDGDQDAAGFDGDAESDTSDTFDSDGSPTIDLLTDDTEWL